MPTRSPRPAPPGLDPAVSPADRYSIVGRIAAGGMAEIYLSRMKTETGSIREVVLKRLLPELQSDHEFVQMFHDEARIASLLNHPNIVQIFELGELDGSLFIAMELLRGVNLRDLLARLHRSGRQVMIPIAVRIMCEALEGLAYAHSFADARGRRLNVVHRDVSPQNIIVTYEGSVKLVDFGVAKAEGRLHQTRAGLIKGKFAYMAPEQVNGTPLDGRADMFALAEVFYELLLQRHPFYAPTDMEVLRAILEKDPPHPCDLSAEFPPALAKIFLKALEKNPGDRYRNATEMHEALEQFLVEQGSPATTLMLGRYVREIFKDRQEVEQRARAAKDDEALIEAMTAGRAEQLAMYDSKGAKLIPATRSKASELAAPRSDTTDKGDRVIELTKDTPPPKETLDEEPSEGARRIAADVRNIFDESGGGVDPAESIESGELPTIATPALRISEPPAALPRTQAVPERPYSEPTAPVVQQAPKKRPRRRDWIGHAFFFSGLFALLGAIVYAALLFMARGQSLTVSSDPPGASIFLNGADTGAKTPVVLPGLPRDKRLLIELRLDGFAPFQSEIPSGGDDDNSDIHVTLKPARPE